jgi:hypothetical protein
VGLPAHQQAPVCLDDPTAARALDPTAVMLSVAQVRLLLQAVLPLPLRDIAATLELVRYQQQRKAAAYYSHRKRILRQLGLAHPP